MHVAYLKYSLFFHVSRKNSFRVCITIPFCPISLKCHDVQICSIRNAWERLGWKIVTLEKVNIKQSPQKSWFTRQITSLMAGIEASSFLPQNTEGHDRVFIIQHHILLIWSTQELSKCSWKTARRPPTYTQVYRTTRWCRSSRMSYDYPNMFLLLVTKVGVRQRSMNSHPTC